MTLNEFLLARITEDERATIGHLDSYVQRERAECEAKRRIVERVADDMALYDHVFKVIKPVDAEDYTSGAVWGLEFALRSLAAVYADHPDYRQEWKP